MVKRYSIIILIYTLFFSLFVTQGTLNHIVLFYFLNSNEIEFAFITIPFCIVGILTFAKFSTLRLIRLKSVFTHYEENRKTFTTLITITTIITSIIIYTLLCFKYTPIIFDIHNVEFTVLVVIKRFFTLLTIGNSYFILHYKLQNKNTMTLLIFTTLVFSIMISMEQLFQLPFTLFNIRSDTNIYQLKLHTIQTIIIYVCSYMFYLLQFNIEFKTTKLYFVFNQLATNIGLWIIFIGSYYYLEKDLNILKLMQGYSKYSIIYIIFYFILLTHFMFSLIKLLNLYYSQMCIIRLKKKKINYNVQLLTLISVFIISIMIIFEQSITILVPSFMFCCSIYIISTHFDFVYALFYLITVVLLKMWNVDIIYMSSIIMIIYIVGRYMYVKNKGNV